MCSKMLLIVLSTLLVMDTVQGQWTIGRGIADVTGLPGDGVLYGYASLEQDARGIHTRQYCRSYIFDDGERRAVVVVAEVTMITQAVHKEVLELLDERYSGLYTASNVIMSPTHSHATPGGYHTYYMYSIPSGGFETATYTTLVNGIVLSIDKAHEDMQPGRMFFSQETTTDASLNRSPYSYDQNPAEERYEYDYNVDADMSLLKLTSEDGTPLGALSFFPIHTTSMKRSNHLISTDNKGYASQMMERELNGGQFPAQDILTAFLQTAEGDVSPNINDARCEATDDRCSYNTSACPEDLSNPGLCLGRGPTGRYLEEMDDFEDTKIMGEMQRGVAMRLYNSYAEEMTTGKVDHRFTWVNMTEQEVDVDGEMVQLCPPNLGYSFGAGATDGPGFAPFTQGMLEGLPNIEDLLDELFPDLRPDWLRECASPRPLLLPTGLAERPYPHWQPSVVPIQTVRIGELVLIGIPAETTTMAGRRLIKAVQQVYADAGEPDVIPMVLSMANSYSSYLTTKEEYQVQRYEGASVIFGPNTLLAYTDIVKSLTQAMIEDEPVDEGTWPPDLRGFPDEARGQTKFDLLPEDSDLTYGDVIVDVQSSYGQGDIVQAVFVGANPRNNYFSMIDATYMEVQRLDNDEWTTVYTDTHWETKFYWDSDCHGRWAVNITGCGYEQTSNTTLEWTTAENEQPGTYRLFHRGHARIPSDEVIPYSGESSAFTVVAQHNRKRSLLERVSTLPRTAGWMGDDEEDDDWHGEKEELHEEDVFRLLKRVVVHW